MARHFHSGINSYSANSTAQAMVFQDSLTCHFHFSNCLTWIVSKCVDQSQSITHWEIRSSLSFDITIGKEWVSGANWAHHSTLSSATPKVWQKLASNFCFFYKHCRVACESILSRARLWCLWKEFQTLQELKGISFRRSHIIDQVLNLHLERSKSPSSESHSRVEHI